MNKTFDKFFWISLIIFLLLVIGICFLPSILTGEGEPDFSQKGQIGDTIGGIMGPFVAIIAAWLTFIAFWVQFKANIHQRQDIAVERFERNLFELIHLQQEITNGLVIEHCNNGSSVMDVKQGREVFPYLYEKMKDRYAYSGGEEINTFKRILLLDEKYKFNLVAVRQLWFLDHYFRHLYRIFKYIDNAEVEFDSKMKKQEYAAIVRATLSPYELVMLYYIGYSHPRMKVLIEKYALLNNLRPILLADVSEGQLVAKKMNKRYTHAMDKDIDSAKEYKKSVFVLE
jgi:hypothetical protein